MNGDSNNYMVVISRRTLDHVSETSRNATNRPIRQASYVAAKPASQHALLESATERPKSTIASAASARSREEHSMNGVTRARTFIVLTMGNPSRHSGGTAAPRNRNAAPVRFATAAFAVFAVLTALLVAPLAQSGSGSTTKPTVFRPVANPPYPIGTPDSTEPSGLGPPSPTAMAGYHQSYVNTFSGSSVPPGWDVYSGVPGGDPGAHFGASHVVVGGGLMTLETYRDPNWNNQFVTGGLCQCGLARTYGAYFVRSRLTGRGPNEVDLLWPAAHVWPPEIDFSETGDSIASTTGSVHYGATNHIDHLSVIINMTKWHTWGVIWTSRSIIFVVDGQVWGTDRAPSHIPRQAMTLDIQQSTRCSSDTQCPTGPVSMQVNWVAEYSAN